MILDDCLVTVIDRTLSADNKLYVMTLTTKNNRLLIVSDYWTNFRKYSFLLWWNDTDIGDKFKSYKTEFTIIISGILI